MGRMKVLVLIDGLHSQEILDALARLVDLRAVDLLLAYVAGPTAHAGLDLVREGHGPGARPMPPHRERELREAEESAGDAALSDAGEAARDRGARVETIRVEGKAGHAICELASQRRADLVVVRAGGWDRPPIGPGSLGKEARFIADHCRAPVLLLRTG
jgi:nucleotide-binding universal stress UspA family protein